MRIKRKNGLKIAAIAIALLLCLALAVGITGAWYQAKRQATGTLSMDQGIIIDYKGFDKTPDEGIWTRETTTTFLLFDETNAQPGQNIPVNAAGIRANEKSVNFYARVKLSYKFYNGETPVELADATKLIKTSSSFFGTNWVDGGSSDGYYYYATGSTLNKFEKGAAATTFVDLFATDAKFIIEGAGFTGADNDGESGGFKIDDTTLINKIEVYLTLETLQGDATAEQAKALGWKIASEVDFAKVDEGKIVKSNTTTEVTDEKLNVTINDKTTSLETVKFPYDEEVILNFDSRNVDYITLNYSNGETETFGLSADDFANDYLSETALKVTAKSSKGTVKGYTVGLWDSEYTGFTYLSDIVNEDGTKTEIGNGIAVSGYYGTEESIIIKSSVKIRKRNFKIVLKDMKTMDDYYEKSYSAFTSIIYPCTVKWNNGNESKIIAELNTLFEMESKIGPWINEHNDDDFTNYTITLEAEACCETDSIFYSTQNVVEINSYAFAYAEFTEITIPNTITKINTCAFQGVGNLKTITIPSNINFIAGDAFWECSSLTTTIGEGWVKASDNTAVDANTLLKDISYDIKRA